MGSKVVGGFFIKSYEHLKLGVGVHNFRNYQMYVSFQILGTKVCNLIEHFGIFCEDSSNRKMRFQVQKLEKYLKFKNDLKRPLGAFNQDL